MKKKDLLQVLFCILLLVLLFVFIGLYNDAMIKRCINNGVDASICYELKN